MAERVYKVLEILVANCPIEKAPTSERAELESLMNALKEDVEFIVS